MLVAREFVFIHIPRTGGSFVRSVLAGHIPPDPDAPAFATHAAYRELPPELRDRPAFCIVRNPWDWYVSWYHNGLKHRSRLSGLEPGNPKREIWDRAFGAGHSSFAEAVTAACEGAFEHPVARVARERDIDLYSAYLRVQAGGELKRGRVDAGRFEELLPFLLGYFDELGVLSEPLREELERTPPVNASEHGDYRDYYDDRLRELVGRKARRITAQYGYEF
jgi:hypothetical protein